MQVACIYRCGCQLPVVKGKRINAYCIDPNIDFPVFPAQLAHSSESVGCHVDISLVAVDPFREIWLAPDVREGIVDRSIIELGVLESAEDTIVTLFSLDFQQSKAGSGLKCPVFISLAGEWSHSVFLSHPSQCPSDDSRRHIRGRMIWHIDHLGIKHGFKSQTC